jgi:lipid-binding SYLF domain-containing protein
MLVMPDIVKGGFLIGGAYGEGALRIDGRTEGYYSLAAASVGLQLGVQSSKQALLFMTDDALARFRNADGWVAGADAEVTIPGDGLHTGLSTKTSKPPVIAIVFGQDGVLAGASVSGAKYSRINR